MLEPGGEGEGRRGWVSHPLLVQSDLLGEALLGKVAHSVVVSIRQEVRQLVLGLGILLQTFMHSTHVLPKFLHGSLQLQLSSHRAIKIV